MASHPGTSTRKKQAWTIVLSINEESFIRSRQRPVLCGRVFGGTGMSYPCDCGLVTLPLSLCYLEYNEGLGWLMTVFL